MKNILLLVLVMASLMPIKSSAQCDNAIGAFPPDSTHLIQSDGTLTPGYWTVSQDSNSMYFGETMRVFDNTIGQNPAPQWVQTPAFFITPECNGGIWIIDILPPGSLRPHEHLLYRGWMITYDGTEFISATICYPPMPRYPMHEVMHMRLAENQLVENPLENCTNHSVNSLTGASIENIKIPGFRSSFKIEENKKASFLSDVRVGNNGSRSATLLNPSGNSFTVTVLDITGRQIGENTSVQSPVFGLSSMLQDVAPGTYAVVMTTNSERRTVKITIQ